jgi:hypothetical protein
VLQSSQQDTAGAAKSQTKEELQQALKNAIAAEDYTTAARLKEQITEIEMQDPLTGLKWALEAAIEEERYAVSKPFDAVCVESPDTWHKALQQPLTSSHDSSRAVAVTSPSRNSDGPSSLNATLPLCACRTIITSCH